MASVSGLSEAGLRRQRDKGATEQMTTLNRLRSPGEGTALSAANEHKLDSDDDSRNDIHEVQQEEVVEEEAEVREEGAAGAGASPCSTHWRLRPSGGKKESLSRRMKTALSETVRGQIEI